MSYMISAGVVYILHALKLFSVDVAKLAVSDPFLVLL